MTGVILGRLENGRRSKVPLLGPLISKIDEWKWVRGYEALFCFSWKSRNGVRC